MIGLITGVIRMVRLRKRKNDSNDENRTEALRRQGRGWTIALHNLQ